MQCECAENGSLLLVCNGRIKYLAAVAARYLVTNRILCMNLIYMCMLCGNLLRSILVCSQDWGSSGEVQAIRILSSASCRELL